MLAQTAIRGVSQQAPIPRVGGDQTLADSIDCIGACMPFLRNAEIYGERVRRLPL